MAELSRRSTSLQMDFAPTNANHASVPKEYLEALARHAPFKYLLARERVSIAAVSQVKVFSKDELVLKQGENNQLGVILVVKGSMYLVDTMANKKVRTGIDKGAGKALFGELEIVLDAPLKYSVYSSVEGTECLIIPTNLFRALIDVSKPFADSTAIIIKPMVDLFRNTDIFIQEINAFLINHETNFDKVITLYKEMQSSLHPFCNTDVLDLGALNYCVRRLPSNVSRTHLWILGRQPPEVIDPTGILLLTSSPARRRACWDMSNGMAFVLMSDDLTDVADLFTCLACYSIEAKKLRYRLSDKVPLGNILFNALKKSNGKESYEMQRSLLSSHFSEAEISKLVEIWPQNLLQVCWEIIIHHENFSFKIQPTAAAQVLPVDLWGENIRLAALELVDDLENASISIVSSNTHSILNLLSPYVHKNKEKITDWGKANDPGAYSAFDNSDDLLYYYIYKYLKAHPDEMIEKQNVERTCGIICLDDVGGTGISVQLIDVACLDRSLMDSRLTQHFVNLSTVGCEDRQLIINIDFAFGKQAETILNFLILLFGQRIKSINILGKAGAIVGKRGDILAPTHFVMFDEMNPKGLLNVDLDISKLSSISGKSDVYAGPVLTVLGTFVQNRKSLHYFKSLWQCIGLEMEGSYYSRAIERGILRGLLSKDVASRFLYYVSDLPLAITGKLTDKLEPWEGIPPLYAISRIIVESIFLLDSSVTVAATHNAPTSLNPISLSRFSSSDHLETVVPLQSLSLLRRATSFMPPIDEDDTNFDHS